MDRGYIVFPMSRDLIPANQHLAFIYCWKTIYIHSVFPWRDAKRIIYSLVAIPTLARVMDAALWSEEREMGKEELYF